MSKGGHDHESKSEASNSAICFLLWSAADQLLPDASLQAKETAAAMHTVPAKRVLIAGPMGTCLTLRSLL